MSVRRAAAMALAAALTCCAPPQRSEQELFLTAANYIAAHDKLVSVSRTEGNLHYSDAHPQIAYADGVELMRLNPECCTLGITPTDDPAPRCAGAAPAYIVSVRYRARYLADDGLQAEKEVTRNVGIDRGGLACDTLRD